MLFLKDKLLNVSVIFITAGDHFIAGLKALQNFVIFRVLIAQLTIGPVGGFTVIAHFEYPVATRLVVKSTAGHEYRLSFFTEGQQDLQGLTSANTFGDFSDKLHIHLKMPIGKLGVHFKYPEIVIAVSEIKDACQSIINPGEIVWIFGYFHGKVSEYINLAQAITFFFILAYFGIQGGKLAFNG